MLQAILFSPYGAFIALFVVTMTIAIIKQKQGKEIKPSVLAAILLTGGVLTIIALLAFY